MPVRSLSRALKSTVAAGALALAIPGAAFAMPASPNPDAPAANASGNVTAGTDVAAPDQQNPVLPETKPVQQQAPTWPTDPQVLTRPVAASTPSTSDFQWGDAGIGAGGALVVLLAGFGGVLAIRRRHVADPPLPA
jgi:hypothetical protein